MRHFFKLVTSSCLGTICAIFLLFGIFMLFALVNQPKKSIQSGSVLHLSFDKTTPELTNNVVQDDFFNFEPEVIGLNDMKSLIDHAASDPNIMGILIEPKDMVGLSLSEVLNVSRILNKFKESGKFIEAYANYYTQKAYAISSVADKMTINPNGITDMRGFGSVIPYLKDFSSKTKIKFDVYYAGKFKSAIEPYYRSESSQENRHQTQEFLHDFELQYAQLVGKNRGLSSDDIINVMRSGSSSDFAQQSVDLGLVDSIQYRNDFVKSLCDRHGLKKLKLVDLPEYHINISKQKNTGKDRIAVVYMEGVIDHNGSEKDRGNIHTDRYEKIFSRLIKNDKVKAVVLRVNSPGGSAFTSDVIWKRIEDLKESGKYVVASYGTYAASGGYYLSCGVDKIVSEPTTLTGSIGVFSMIPDMHEFFDDKLGIDWDTIGTGRHSFLYSVMASRSDADHKKLMRATERIYDQFLDRVAQGRQMTKDQVNEIAQGRVWSGQDAIEVGLVDTIGWIEDAIEIASRESGADNYKILQYPVIQKEFYEEILAGFASEMSVIKSGLHSKLVDNNTARQLTEFIDHVEDACETPQARLPFQIID